MPQMAPLSWVVVMIATLISLLLALSKFYFMDTTKSLSLPQKFFHPLPWKW